MNGSQVWELEVLPFGAEPTEPYNEMKHSKSAWTERARDMPKDIQPLYMQEKAEDPLPPPEETPAPWRMPPFKAPSLKRPLVDRNRASTAGMQEYLLRQIF